MSLNKEQIRSRQRTLKRLYYKLDPEKYKARVKQWKKENLTMAMLVNKAASRTYDRRIRLAALMYYSNTEIPSCACCGEGEIDFLCIDHIDGGGNEQRKSGVRIYRWLKVNGYPTGFQVLCHNCNMAKGFYGVCPHKKHEQHS